MLDRELSWSNMPLNQEVSAYDRELASEGDASNAMSTQLLRLVLLGHRACHRCKYVIQTVRPLSPGALMTARASPRHSLSALLKYLRNTMYCARPAAPTASTHRYFSHSVQHGCRTIQDGLRRHERSRLSTRYRQLRHGRSRQSEGSRIGGERH
jgi:hypothetical protein